MKSLLLLGLVLLTACGARTATAIGTDVETDASTKPDVSAKPDASTLATTITGLRLYEDCMPLVAPDPVNIQGDLHIENATGATMGPITITSGEILDGSTVIATFAVEKANLGTLAPGSASSTGFVKSANSLSSKKGCQTVACSKMFRVALVLSGQGIPAGTRAVSAPSEMACTD